MIITQNSQKLPNLSIKTYNIRLRNNDEKINELKNRRETEKRFKLW